MCTERILNSLLSLAEKYPIIFNYPEVIPAVEKKLSKYLTAQKIDIYDPKNSTKITSQIGRHFFMKVVQTACECGFLCFSAELMIDNCVRPLPSYIFTKGGLLLGSILAIITHTVPYLHVHAKIQAELPPLPPPIEPSPHKPRVTMIKI